MKLNRMKLAVAAAAGIASSSAMAIGYDAASETVTGKTEREMHVWQVASLFEQGECTTAVCLGLGGGNTEILGIIDVPNKTLCVEAGDGSCDTFPQVEDRYCGGAAPCAGHTNDLGQADTPDTAAFTPDHKVLRVYSANQTANKFQSLGTDTLFPDASGNLVPITKFHSWDFTTAPNGKITSGYYIADTTFFGTTIIGIVDFDNRVLINMSGTIANVNISCYQNTNTEAGYEACAALETGVTYSNFSDASYITIPDTEQDSDLAKSVPVPAFAAAALGLGLVGITAMTSRRRQLK